MILNFRFEALSAIFHSIDALNFRHILRADAVNSLTPLRSIMLLGQPFAKLRQGDASVR
ncbi:hypothetical protein LTSEINV_6193 [Salmonella enterica subsp. enterica serovar Inverness str. R8-3668]|uniref:Uncharacterized protein n=1 Tax=Salmonella enterica subsp. enterica serovar Inverness str. R8-3668 TaxID=913075 RepID=G5NLT8_SALET|nr:hypothetical protein LTSEINV_6193 [Salmonella enterica subsp. enterica serovar Inverness str. R8-3668]